MPNYQPVSKTAYGNKRWLRYSSYAHAAEAAVAPLSVQELPKAAMGFPIGFTKQGDSFETSLVMNVMPGKNLYVAPGGVWAGRYVPAAFRSYPFAFGSTPDGQLILCVDEDSGLVSEGPEGEPMFDDEGNPTDVIKEIIGFLNTVKENRKVTKAACSVLAKHEVIQPWLINVQTAEGEQKVEGLYRIDEAKLSQLSPEALAEVRDAGGLMIAYCQLLSMQHLPVIGELIKAHAKVAEDAAKQAATKEIDLEFLNKDSSISFKGF